MARARAGAHPAYHSCAACRRARLVTWLAARERTTTFCFSGRGLALLVGFGLLRNFEIVWRGHGTSAGGSDDPPCSQLRIEPEITMDTPEAIAASYLQRRPSIDISSALSRGWALVRDHMVV